MNYLSSGSSVGFLLILLVGVDLHWIDGDSPEADVSVYRNAVKLIRLSWKE